VPQKEYIIPEQYYINKILDGYNLTDKLSNAEATLLGLISEQPMYPYQIEQQIKYREMRAWTDLSMSSIYKLLQKLENNTLINRRDEVSPENRLQKIYTITDKGKKALQEKIKTLLSNPEHTKWQIDIGTYNIDLIEPDEAYTALIKYRSGLEEKIECYEALLKFLQDEGCPIHRYAIASRPLFLLKAEIQWVDAFLNQLNLKPKTKKDTP